MSVSVSKAGGTGETKPLRCLVYGASRRAKTTFAATAPNPVFLSVSSEGGERTLQVCFPWVDVININSTDKMKEAVEFIRFNHKARGWRTVVVDSLSFYVETFVAELARKKKIMTQQDWGALDLHVVKWLREELHGLPLHIIWICLEQQIKNDATGAIVRMEPMMPGKSASKLPASCDLVLYADNAQVKDPQGNLVTGLLFRTQTNENNVIAGGRFGNLFSEGWIHPHFAEVVQRIGPYIGETMDQYTQPTAPGDGATQQQIQN